MTTAAPQAWTTRRLLAWIGGKLRERDIDDARLCAEMLVAHVLGCERLRLYMEADRPASADELAMLRELVRRALSHEPVQYLVGEASFYGISLLVDRRVLIPRPETQTLVDEVVAAIKPIAAPRVADVCTGTGCVAIAVAKQAPHAVVNAGDIDDDALAVAGDNLERTGVADRVSLHAGDLLGALPEDSTYHAIAANPPYIPDDEWAGVAANVRDFEPEHALRGGVDGMDLVRRLIDDAPQRLEPGGVLAIEVASTRAALALEIAEASGRYAEARMVRDFAGRPRVLVARLG
ncbi:MAG: peptide chain release factor N(5)-glutamine methyltransferase [Planctomycetota bacterium]